MQPFQGDAQEWNELIARLPNAHLLQSWQWSQVKAEFGWQPQPLIWRDGARIQSMAMLLKRRLPIRGFSARLSLLYLPKGPTLDWQDHSLREQVLNDLQAYTVKQSAIFLKIDPDVVLGCGIPGHTGASELPGGQTVQADLMHRGWRFSSDQIQFRNTVMVDLSVPEDELLARMKQKTRYNIRLAGRKGVSIRVGNASDIPMLLSMYAETAVRDGFVIRDQAYYRTVWEGFMREQPPQCEPLIAEVAGIPVAAIFVFYFSGIAYYLYGMSREIHREKMPNYLLQWEAMCRAKAKGCRSYDLWGAPEVFEERDALWGVYRFKEGFGGQVRRTLGAWDFAPRPFYYHLYTELIPRMLNVMRIRGMARTKQKIGA